MAVDQIDPGTLEGDNLRRWYMRSPADLEQERQDAASQRYQDFFGHTGRNPDPGFDRGLQVDGPDIDPGFSRDFAAPTNDIAPGFTWIPAGPNRLRSVSTSSDQVDSQGSSGPTSAPLPELDMGYARPITRNMLVLTTASSPPPNPSWAASYPSRPSAGPTSSPIGIAGEPNRATYAGARTGSPPPRINSPSATAPPQIAYGALRASAPSDQELADLRRQQAAFANTARQIDIHNSWLTIPALAPVAAVLGLEGAAAVAGRALVGESVEGPLNFVDREAWQRGAQRAAQALSDAEKAALRTAARTRYARANGISASEMQAEVHHSEPLEWAHLKPEGSACDSHPGVGRFHQGAGGPYSNAGGNDGGEASH